MRDDRFEHVDVLSDSISHALNDGFIVVGSEIHHCEENAVDLQFGIDTTLNLAVGTKQQIQTFSRKNSRL